MDLLSNYFTYIPGDHSSKYIGGDGELSLGDYDLDGKIDISWTKPSFPIIELKSLSLIIISENIDVINKSHVEHLKKIEPVCSIIP